MFGVSEELSIGRHKQEFCPILPVAVQTSDGPVSLDASLPLPPDALLGAGMCGVEG